MVSSLQFECRRLKNTCPVSTQDRRSYLHVPCKSRHFMQVHIKCSTKATPNILDSYQLCLPCPCCQAPSFVHHVMVGSLGDPSSHVEASSSDFAYVVEMKCASAALTGLCTAGPRVSAPLGKTGMTMHKNRPIALAENGTPVPTLDRREEQGVTMLSLLSMQVRACTAAYAA